MVAALREAGSRAPQPLVVGGRYGLASKEFTPGDGEGGVRRAGRATSRASHFTVGIVDDVTHTLAARSTRPSTSRPRTRTRAVFFGLGADGTVGANKNSIKIIGEETDHDAQGYYVYDSKKSGAVTISHLRFGPGPIRSSYLIRRASFVACHQFGFLDRLRRARARRAGRRLPAERAVPARRRCGTRSPARCRKRSSRSGSASG